MQQLHHQSPVSSPFHFRSGRPPVDRGGGEPFATVPPPPLRKPRPPPAFTPAASPRPGAHNRSRTNGTPVESRPANPPVSAERQIHTRAGALSGPATQRPSQKFSETSHLDRLYAAQKERRASPEPRNSPMNGKKRPLRARFAVMRGMCVRAAERPPISYHVAR